MKILVIKFRNIGDVLLSTPLIENLQHYFPNAKIDFALNEGCEDMLTDNPNINEIIIYNRSRIKKLNIFLQIKEEIRFTRAIRSEKYDIVINLTEGDRGAQLALISNAKMKQELKEIEDRILMRLSSSEGSPVDDIDLINTLDASKIKSMEIQV